MGRDLLIAVGWAAFIGVGVALGLWLGSLGADVPADSGMLVAAMVISGAGTLVVRLAMVFWKHRPGGTSEAPRAPATTTADANLVPPEPGPETGVEQSAPVSPSTTANRRRAPATKTAPGAKKASPTKKTAAAKTAAAKKVSASKKATPTKKASGAKKATPTKKAAGTKKATPAKKKPRGS